MTWQWLCMSVRVCLVSSYGRSFSCLRSLRTSLIHQNGALLCCFRCRLSLIFKSNVLPQILHSHSDLMWRGLLECWLLLVSSCMVFVVLAEVSLLELCSKKSDWPMLDPTIGGSCSSSIADSGTVGCSSGGFRCVVSTCICSSLASSNVNSQKAHCIKSVCVVVDVSIVCIDPSLRANSSSCSAVKYAIND